MRPHRYWCRLPTRIGGVEWIVFPLSTTQSIYLFPFIIRLRFPSPVEFKYVILLPCTTSSNAISDSNAFDSGIKMTSIDLSLLHTFYTHFLTSFFMFRDGRVSFDANWLTQQEHQRYDSKGHTARVRWPLHPTHSIRFCDLYFFIAFRLLICIKIYLLDAKSNLCIPQKCHVSNVSTRLQTRNLCDLLCVIISLCSLIFVYFISFLFDLFVINRRSGDNFIYTKRHWMLTFFEYTWDLCVCDVRIACPMNFTCALTYIVV